MQPAGAKTVPATGWGADQTVSGPVSCASVVPAVVTPPPPPPPPPAPSVAAAGPADQCPGQFQMPGYGTVAIVPTGWSGAPGAAKIGNLEVHGSKVVTHMEGRAYFADRCTGSYNHTDYLALKLLNKKITYTVDVSKADCGCNAAFYMTSMHQNKRKSECFDYYCDANNVCGESCAEVDIMEANKYAFHSTLHTTYDHGGQGVGYGGGVGWNGPRDFTGDQYGPGASCIDTDLPFDVSSAFPVNDQGYIDGMFMQLSQAGKDCELKFAVTNYKGNQELSQALANGMTPILSYWESTDMLWMDGEGSDHLGPCHTDHPKTCGDTVLMYNFKVDELDFVVRAEPAEQPVWTPPPTQPPAWTPPPTVPAGPTTTVITTTTTIPCSITRKADCRFSECCLDPGMQCYEKHSWWAACQLDCTPGVDLRDPEGHHTPWSCRPLGERTPGIPIVTTTTTGKMLPAPAGEAENEAEDEAATIDVPTLPPTEAPTSAPAPVVPVSCAESLFENCKDSQCCKDPGMQCYQKHSYWSACYWECPSRDGDVWSCKQLGTRTPGDPITTTTSEARWVQVQKDVVEEGVQTNTATYTTTRPPCSITRKGDCSQSQCCKDPGMQCFKKDKYWSACELDCTPGIDVRDRPAELQTPWTCEVLGFRTPGIPIVTTTSRPHKGEEKGGHGEGGEEEEALVEAPAEEAPAADTQADTKQPVAPAPWSTNFQDMPWECHDYLEGQDTEWCRTVGAFDGYEYSFVGFDGWHKCGGCWCCKRQVEELDLDALREAEGFTRCSITRKQDCRHTRCCLDPGMQCYEKNAYWAACEFNCNEGIDPHDFGDVRTPWTCAKLGPRSPGEPLVTTTTTTVEPAELPESETTKNPSSQAEQDELEAIFQSLQQQTQTEEGAVYRSSGGSAPDGRLRLFDTRASGGARFLRAAWPVVGAISVGLAAVAVAISVGASVRRRLATAAYLELTPGGGGAEEGGLRRQLILESEVAAAEDNA